MFEPRPRRRTASRPARSRPRRLWTECVFSRCALLSSPHRHRAAVSLARVNVVYRSSFHRVRTNTRRVPRLALPPRSEREKGFSVGKSEPHRAQQRGEEMKKLTIALLLALVAARGIGV